MMKRLAFILLAACMTARVHAGLFGPSEKELASLHRAAVVSLLGDTYHMVFVGTTVFSNKSYDFPVPEWKLNEFARDEVLRLASIRGRFKCEALDLTGPDAGMFPNPVVINKLQAADRKRLIELARQQGFDSLIVIQQGDWGETVVGLTPGYGFYRHAFMGLDQSGPYAALALELYSVDTGKTVATRSTQPNAAGKSSLEVKVTLDAYSDGEQLAMENDVKQQITASLEAILQKMKILQPQ